MSAPILLRDFQATELELWRFIPNFPGYEISSLGRLRSYKIDRWAGGRLRSTNNVVRGYVTVKLSLNAQVSTLLLHRLVAQVFVPNPHNKPEVNHLNGIKTDNRAANMQWVTRQENINHAVQCGLFKGSIPGSKLSFEKAAEIRQKRAAGATNRELMNQYDIGLTLLHNTLRGKSWAMR